MGTKIKSLIGMVITLVKSIMSILNIVNEDDEIVGQASRTEIHQLGLLHREVNIYFLTPKNEIIFQHRSQNKDTYPNLLDASVGGHVEIGDSYEETAIKEIFEETGLKLEPSNLLPIKKSQKIVNDKITGRINNAINFRFAYIFPGEMADLKIEAGEGQGFESWPLEKLLVLSDAEKSRFIPAVLTFVCEDLVEFIKSNKINQ